VTPGKPANPPFIIIDTSVLLQLIATDQTALLRCLRSEYRVQPAIVSAVESETSHILNTIPKFKGRQDQLKKALSNNAITLIDRQSVGAFTNTGVDALLRQMNSEGQRFNLRVDRGEAYTHAAASVLDVPVVTNDVTAVRQLIRDNEKVPRPILRFWDLIVFCRQIDQIDDSSCDIVRQSLTKLQEGQPQCFTGRAFRTGLAEFYPRLVDGTAPLIGAPNPGGRLDDRLALFR
jgi:hypothetical protein